MDKAFIAPVLKGHLNKPINVFQKCFGVLSVLTIVMNGLEEKLKGKWFDVSGWGSQGLDPHLLNTNLKSVKHIQSHSYQIILLCHGIITCQFYTLYFLSSQ